MLAVGGADLAEVLRELRSSAEIDLRNELGELPPDGQHEILVADYDLLSPGDRDRLLDAFQGLQRKTRLLLVSEKQCREEFPRLFGARALTNLVARNGQVDPENLRVTVRKLLDQDIFGLEKYLDGEQLKAGLTLTRSDQKAEALQVVEQFGNQQGMKSWLVRLLCSVADEFITNAVYNAPVDDLGVHRFAHYSRSTAVELDPHEGVDVRIATDGKRVAVSTADPFGSLTPARLLDYLAKCFRKGDDQVDYKPGGAGLGFYTVFESLTHFVVNLAPDRRTEMIGLFDVEKSYRQFASRNKSFNIFMTA
jgi:hypothetical protein